MPGRCCSPANPASARRELSSWGGPVAEIDNELLRELADLYRRLDAFPLAIDAERYRASRVPPGSLPWFEARYRAGARLLSGRSAEGRPGS